MSDEFGKLLREIRRAKESTMVEAAEAVGCSPSAWSAWERGVVVPSRNSRKRLMAWIDAIKRITPGIILALVLSTFCVGCIPRRSSTASSSTAPVECRCYDPDTFPRPFSASPAGRWATGDCRK